MIMEVRFFCLTFFGDTCKHHVPMSVTGKSLIPVFRKQILLPRKYQREKRILWHVYVLPPTTDSCKVIYQQNKHDGGKQSI